MVDVDDKMLILGLGDIGRITVKYTEAALQERLNLEPPKTGFFNYNGHALVLFKTPARQWRRGLCGDNHEVYNPFKKLLNEGAYRPGFTANAVRAMFTPKYFPNPEEARTQFGKSCHSVALSRHLMISKSPVEGAGHPLVWFDSIPVGFMRDDRFQIEDDEYHQEVHDELRRAGQERWIS